LLDVGCSPAVAGDGYVEIECGVLFQRDKVEKRIKGDQKHCFQCDLTLRAALASGEQVYLKNPRTGDDRLSCLSFPWKSDATPQLGVTGEEMPRMDTDPAQMALLRAPRLVIAVHNVMSGLEQPRIASCHIFA